METSVNYEVQYEMPGSRLNPPQEEGEWWTHSLTDFAAGGRFDKTNAEILAGEIRKQRGYKTRLIKVTISREILDGDES